MNKMEQLLATIDIEPKLKAFIRHLVTSFPECGLLSRQIGEDHHVFIIKPYGGVPEKPSRSSEACRLGWLARLGILNAACLSLTCHDYSRHTNGVS